MTGSELSTQDSQPPIQAPYFDDELKAFIELLYWRNGTVPDARQLRAEIDGCTVTDEYFDNFLKQKSVRDYFAERGVPVAAQARLTPKQLEWIRTITDPTDFRPLHVKMKEADVSQADIKKWNMSPFFTQIVYEQSNRTFGNSRFAVLRQLQVEAMAGNLKAIQLYLEMTGDYKNQQEVNVHVETRNTVNIVLEVIEECVPPDLLPAILERLEAAVVPALPSTNPLLALPEPPRMNAKPIPKKPQRRTIDVSSQDFDGWK